MALNERKVIEVILRNLSAVEPRYDGYIKDLEHLVVNIITSERQHQTRKFPIVQDISDKINTVGMDLFKAQEKQ